MQRAASSRNRCSVGPVATRGQCRYDYNDNDECSSSTSSGSVSSGGGLSLLSSADSSTLSLSWAASRCHSADSSSSDASSSIDASSSKGAARVPSPPPSPIYSCVTNRQRKSRNDDVPKMLVIVSGASKTRSQLSKSKLGTTRNKQNAHTLLK